MKTARARELLGGISRSHLYELAARGEVEAVRPPGVKKNSATLWRTISLMGYVARMQSIHPVPRRKATAEASAGGAA